MSQSSIKNINQAREPTKLKTASYANIEYTTNVWHTAQFKVWLARGDCIFIFDGWIGHSYVQLLQKFQVAS